MRIYMQLPAIENKAPRYYHLLMQRDLLNGWTVVREWGRQGAGGRVKSEHFDTQEAAQTALLRVRDTQLKKGYRVVFVQGATAPCE